MAKTDPRNADFRQNIAGFGGVAGNVGLSADRAAEIRNFRILPDGTLEKRSGYRVMFHLPAPLRGHWEGNLNGISYCFAAAGNKIYKVSPQTGAVTDIYTLTTGSGPVSFVFYTYRLYLMDGKSILIFLPGSQTFSEADGYTPLYGKNWHPTEMGPVNEGRNMILNRIRIHYLNTTGSQSFRFPYNFKEVTRVKVNGNYIHNYSYTPGSSVVTIPANLAAAGGTVEIAATLLDVFDMRRNVTVACRATVYRDAHHETFLCTGPDPGYTIYRSTPVTTDMIADSTAMFGATDPLYIRENTALTVGSIQHPVTALCQCREQMLVMNDQSLWAIRHTGDESDDMQVSFLRNGIGCCSVDAVTLCGDDPVTVQEDGIYRLRFSIANPNVFSEERISDDIISRLSPEDLHHAVILWDRIAGELWFRSTAGTDGTVWLYAPEKKRWICYDGFHAVCLYAYDGNIAFGTPDGDVCVTGSALQTDAGKEISACYQSHYFCFSEPELYRRALRAALCYTSGGGTVGLQLENERNQWSDQVSAVAGTAPAMLDLRVPSGRFRFLRFRICADGSSPCRIHFLSLSANY